MERTVTLNDPNLDVVIDAVLGLTSHVQNLYDIVKKHHHFTTDADNPDGGIWTTLNDTVRDADLESIKGSLQEIKDGLEDLQIPAA